MEQIGWLEMMNLPSRRPTSKTAPGSRRLKVVPVLTKIQRAIWKGRGEALKKVAGKIIESEGF